MVTWEEILHQWPAVLCDLHSEYGIDLDRHLLLTRTWAWLRARILGLLQADTRTHRALRPPEEG